MIALTPAHVECAAENDSKSDAESQSPERKALENVIERFVSAWNGGDAESLASLFSPDGQLVNPWGSVTRTRPQIKQVIAKERSTRLEGTTLRKIVDRINFVGPDSAVLIGKYAISGVHLLFGLRTSFEGPFIFRLKKQESGWAIVKADVSRS
jgi:uncharacterized protein (TIGR02246 family)